MIKDILTESYRTTKKMVGIDPSKPGNISKILVDDHSFGIYVDSLAESLEARDNAPFRQLAENTRMALLESSMYGATPYDALFLPMLRVFYPKLIAKELVTVSPMDKPETFRPFLRVEFSQANNLSTRYQAPVMSKDISSGPLVGSPIAAAMSLPAKDYDVLATLSLDKTKTHLERTWRIDQVYDGTTWYQVDMMPAAEGHFSVRVAVASGTDVISGQVDYLNGVVNCVSTGKVTQVRYICTCSLEENLINPEAEIFVDKIRLYAKDRTISAKWSIQAEQDMKNLFDVSLQAEIVSVLGQQIAKDIDQEIIADLISTNTKMNGATHTDTFSVTPPAGYGWGPKMWHENIIPVLNKLSAVVYNDTNMDEANTIACNPLDAAILQDLQTFNYTGSASNNGDMGYRTAVVGGGKWKVLTSSIVPQGTMVLTYVPTEESKAVYFYAPYVPALMHPYPLRNNPSLSLLTRYAKSFARPKGVATLTLS